MVLTTLDTSYEWNYIVIVLLWLAYFSLSTMPFRFGYVVACDRISLFLRLHSMSLYVCTAFSFFIHSSVKGHLGCFQLLAVVNYTAVHMEVQISLWDFAFNSFRYIPGRRISGPCGTCIFGGTTMLFPTAAAPFHIPTNSSPVFQFLYILANIYFLFF